MNLKFQCVPLAWSGIFAMGFCGGSTVKNPSAIQGTQDRSLGRRDALEKEIATHSSIIAGEISWTEEPSGLYSPWGLKELDTT